MKFLLPCLLFISLNTNAQKYAPVDSASKVHFVIKNFGIATGGDFAGLKGDVLFLPENLAGSSFDVSVATSTVDTDNGMRDKSLVSDEYFDAAKFPLIKIVSSKIEKTNKTTAGFYYFTGSIIIKGVTKAIAFPFQAKEENNGYLFTGSFNLNRTDFQVGSQSIVLSNLVAVTLSVFAKKN
ncbi:MAG: YceI family protein [Ginsengibacter sp.]